MNGTLPIDSFDEVFNDDGSKVDLCKVKKVVGTNIARLANLGTQESGPSTTPRAMCRQLRCRSWSSRTRRRRPSRHALAARARRVLSLVSGAACAVAGTANIVSCTWTATMQDLR